MNLFIGCSSHTEIDNKYIEDTEYICNKLSEIGYDLVIGGYMGDGMIGKAINSFTNNKRQVKIYTLNLYKEDFSMFSGEYKYVKNTFDRTKSLYNDASKILILPGGTGTLAEIFSMLEDNRTIKCDKEIIIYNQDGYYYDLIKFITKLIKNKFNDSNILNYLKVFNNKEDLIKYMEV